MRRSAPMTRSVSSLCRAREGGGMTIRIIPAEQKKLLQIFGDGLAAFDLVRDYIAEVPDRW